MGRHSPLDAGAQRIRHGIHAAFRADRGETTDAALGVFQIDAAGKVVIAGVSLGCDVNKYILRLGLARKSAFANVPSNVLRRCFFTGCHRGVSLQSLRDLAVSNGFRGINPRRIPRSVVSGLLRQRGAGV